MIRVSLFAVFVFSSTIEGYSQNKPKIYFSGVSGNFIKKSQLSDTSIRIVTSVNIPKEGVGVTIYFGGEGFSSVMETAVSLGAYLKYLNRKLVVGNEITIGTLVVLDSKSKKTMFFEGCSYKIVDD